MGQKRTPALVKIAKRLRAADRSFAEIAEELSKEAGKPISKASVIAWLDEKGAAATAPAPPPELPTPPPEPLDESPIEVEKLYGTLAGFVRQQKDLAQQLTAKGDHAGAQRVVRLLAQMVRDLGKMHARDDEDGDFVRVRSTDIAAAAERARSKLHDLVSRLSEARRP